MTGPSTQYALDALDATEPSLAGKGAKRRLQLEELERIAKTLEQAVLR